MVVESKEMYPSLNNALLLIVKSTLGTGIVSNIIIGLPNKKGVN